MHNKNEYIYLKIQKNKQEEIKMLHKKIHKKDNSKNIL